jgi:hypothetical protein
MSLYHGVNLVTRIVDSSKRYQGTISNFHIDLQLPLHSSEFNKIAVIGISIPKSFYDIDDDITGLTLTENTTTINVNIPAGFYNSTTLKNALSLALTTNSPNNFTYTVTYSSVTNKFTFTCSDTVTPLELGFPEFPGSLYQQCGFLINDVVSFTAGVLTSTHSIAIPKINRLFIKSDACNTSIDQILQEVYVTGIYPSLSYIFWESPNLDLYSKDFTLSTNNTYNFQIVDKNGQEVEFNNQEVIFSICLYKKDNTNEAVLQNLRIDNEEKLLKMSQ